jgi:putative ABC transport system permease protein
MNNLKTAVRSLSREKTNSIINLVGLMLGITGSLVLFLVIRHSLSYDNYHAKADRIYRVVQKAKGNTGDTFTSGVQVALPEAFRSEFPEAEAVVFTAYRAGSVVTIPQRHGLAKRYEEDKGVVYTESSFFQVFDRKILSGDGQHGLDQPGEAIISQRLALKYFGREDVVGEVVKLDTLDYTITAVMDNYPVNTDLPFDLMLSQVTLRNWWNALGWNNVNGDDQCYFLLSDKASPADIEARMDAFVTKYVGRDNPLERNFLIQPLREVHTDGRFSNYSRSIASAGTTTGLSIVGIFLLATAVINFINLTTAASIKRAREVGIRKSLGSSRGQLVVQFLSETFLVTVAAAVLSIAGAQLFLQFLNPFMQTSVTLSLADSWVIVYLGSTIIGITLLAGLYPAAAVSSFRPALALRNMVADRTSSGYTLRRALVVVQFFISQFFIIGCIVIVQQMDFMQGQDLGFTRNAVVIVPFKAAPDNSLAMRSLKHDISQLPGVEAVSLSSAPPSSGMRMSTTVQLSGAEQEYFTDIKYADGDYMKLYNLQMVAGRPLDDADTMAALVVNEKFARTLGFPEPRTIVGEQISFWGRTLPVVGVVKDFHITSLRSGIDPVMMLNSAKDYRSLSVKVRGAGVSQTLRQIASRWQKSYPEGIFHYQFLDDQIAAFYDGQQKALSVLGVFASLAIVIGCLGLFGLATYMANHKTKEVGVRKVLGATIGSILLMFSKEYARLILIGFVLAAVLSWFLMQQYLEQFAYRITPGVGTFLVGLGVTCLIAVVTVGYRSLRAATANPVESLRAE